MTTGDFGRGPFGPDPFEEFLARFFGAPGSLSGRGGPVRRIDLARLMSQEARDLLSEAARKAAEWGSDDLDTEHLLWATTQREPLRVLLSRTGSDPDRLAEEIARQSRRGEPREELPSLTPAAKRTLLEAHQVSRSQGVSYLGPEHILLALTVHPDTAAGALLASRGITPQALQEAAGERVAPGARPESRTPTVDRYGRDLTALAREGGLDPV